MTTPTPAFTPDPALETEDNPAALLLLESRDYVRATFWLQNDEVTYVDEEAMRARYGYEERLTPGLVYEQWLATQKVIPLTGVSEDEDMTEAKIYITGMCAIGAVAVAYASRYGDGRELRQMASLYEDGYIAARQAIFSLACAVLRHNGTDTTTPSTVPLDVIVNWNDGLYVGEADDEYLPNQSLADARAEVEQVFGNALEDRELLEAVELHFIATRSTPGTTPMWVAWMAPYTNAEACADDIAVLQARAASLSSEQDDVELDAHLEWINDGYIGSPDQLFVHSVMHEDGS